MLIKHKNENNETKNKIIKKNVDREFKNKGELYF